MSGVRCIVALFAIAAWVPLPAAAQADPNKVLRVAFPVAETGFDPQASNDLYSNHVNRAIFDTPYTYDYLARPYKLVPNTAVALPEIFAEPDAGGIPVSRSALRRVFGVFEFGAVQAA
jgi:ABC-type oligopeptide transport system substrate-binding subunit